MKSHSAILSAVVDELKRVPFSRVYKIHGGRYQQAGLPDLVFIHKASGEMFARARYVEVKTEADEPSPIQTAIFDDIRKCGGDVVVVRSAAEVRDWLKRNGDIE